MAFSLSFPLFLFQIKQIHNGIKKNFKNRTARHLINLKHCRKERKYQSMILRYEVPFKKRHPCLTPRILPIILFTEVL